MADTADWQDATDLIKRTAGDLPRGHMVCQEPYTMSEAMSALELMDPKMDSGTGYRNVQLYEERVACGQLKPIAALTWDEALAAMDFVERAQAAYYDGASAPQTTFTLHYLYHAAATPLAPASAALPHRFLDLFCKLTVRSDEEVREAVARSGVLDEEDFVTMNYGWPTGDALREDELLRTAKELLDGPAAAAATATAAATTGDAAQHVAALERLRVRRALYMALLALDRTQLDAARKHLNLIANRPAPPPPPPLPESFVEPFFIRRLEIPAAPRPVAIPDSAAAHKAAALTASRLVQCIELHNALLTPLSFIEVLHRLRPVAGWGQVERARLAQLLSRDEVKSAVSRQYMLESGLPKLLVDAKQVTDGPFPARANGAFQLLFTTLCYNRSRSRRRMVHVFEELVALSGDALVADSMRPADNALYGPFFTSWTHDLMLTSMLLHLEAGLSADAALQLYQPRELPWLFFYMEFLNSRRVTTLRSVAQLAAQAARRRRGAAKKKAADEAPAVSPLLLQAELHYQTTRAIVCLFTVHAALAKAAGVAEESFPFGTHELRWSTRFYALTRVGAHVPVVPYAYYAKVTGERLARPVADALREASDALEAVKERVKAIVSPADATAPPAPAPLVEEARRVARVAVLNGLALAKAAKRTGPVPRDAVTDFTAHPVYPVLQF